MSEFDSLLRAVLAKPNDDELRIAYADAIVQSDPDRAEIIKLQITLSRWRKAAQRPPGWADAHRRAQILWDRHRTEWSHDVAKLAWVRYPAFKRGFVSQALVSAREFLVHGAELLARAPICYLDVDGLKPVADAFFQSPLLEQLTALGIWRNDLEDAQLQALASSPHLGNLRWLDASHNRIGRDGLTALCQTSNLPHLAYFNFAENAAPDPTPKIGGHDALTNEVLDLDIPELARELEQKYGKKAWLSPAFRPDWPPDVDGV